MIFYSKNSGPQIKIENHHIGCDAPCFIIAEAGVNHNGNIETARQLVKEAAQAGADAIKFQTFKADLLVAPDAPKADYQKNQTDKNESQLEMLKRLEFSKENHIELKKCCIENNITFLSSPFDNTSADLLENIGVPAYKIGAGEITNFPFLAYVASKKKPIILSTGMSFLGEVDEAVRCIKKTGNNDLFLLHCVSNYPARAKDVNLRAILTIGAAFQLPVGYSDHTTGIEISLAAVALGACIIEKHFTLDRHLPGPDHQASIEPDELTKMIRAIRKVEQAMGNGQKEPAESEVETRSVARKSIVAAKDINKGSKLTIDALAIKRPGTGLPPYMLEYLNNRVADREIPAGTIISMEMLK